MRKRDGNRQSRADTFAQHNVYKQTELSLYDGVGAAAAAAVDASVGGVVVVVVIAGSQRQPSCVLFAHARVCVSVWVWEWVACRVGLVAPRAHSGTKVRRVQIVKYFYINKICWKL